MIAKVIKTGEMVDVYHEPQHGQVTNIYNESVLVNGRMWSEDELDFCWKANEAPKKLYLLPNGLISYRRSTDEDVEYISKDAFIEKAEEFIYSALNDGIMGTANIEDFMRLFKKYMKGE